MAEHLFSKQETEVRSLQPAPLTFGVGSSKEAENLVFLHHYSERLPGSVRLVCHLSDAKGIVAAVFFSSPPTRWSQPVLELMRLVRLPNYDLHLTSFIAQSIAAVKQNLSDVDLIVSNADSTQGHHGGIYQAASWNFHEQRRPQRDGFIIDGVFVPRRTCNARWNTSSSPGIRKVLPDAIIEDHYDTGKYLYWKALNKRGKKKAAALGLSCRPYPKPGVRRD